MGAASPVPPPFPGTGIPRAMHPPRIAFRPPPLVLPTAQPDVVPAVGTPVVPTRRPSPPAASAPAGLGPELFRKFGRQDHDLVIQQWEVLRRLMAAIERYVESQVSAR